MTSRQRIDYLARKGTPVAAAATTADPADLGPEDRRLLSAHVSEIVGKTAFDRADFLGEVQRAMAQPRQASSLHTVP